jgi:heme ABC exporter ATP-binding subunit CcmA
LSHHYGRQRALADVNLDVPAGATCVLLGPNGAGKTTLLRLLAGLLAPTQGELRLFGRAARGDQPSLRRRVGWLGHETALYGRLTAAENLRFHARLYGLSRAPQRVAEAIASVGLGAHADRQVGGFSRGMRQRLALARVLLHDPELLLLDEPYTGLDPAGEALLDGFLARAQGDGRTLVIVTHRLDKAASLATLAGFLSRGRLRLLAEAAGPLRGEALRSAAARLFAEARTA